MIVRMILDVVMSVWDVEDGIVVVVCGEYCGWVFWMFGWMGYLVMFICEWWCVCVVWVCVVLIVCCESMFYVCDVNFESVVVVMVWWRYVEDVYWLSVIEILVWLGVFDFVYGFDCVDV